MKKIKKILSVFCAVILTLSLWAPCALAGTLRGAATHRCSHSRRVPIKILYDKDLPPINARILRRYVERKGRMDRMVAILKGQLKRSHGILILDGGTYEDTARADGFECHHLISSHFCSKHPSILSRSKAPAVLIPKEIHCLTGSNPNSGQMLPYLKKEKKVFRIYMSIFGPVLGRQLGLEAVLILGLNDLIESFRTYYGSGKKLASDEILAQPEVKAAVASISDDIRAEELRSPEKPGIRKSATTLREMSYSKEKDFLANRRHSEITRRDLVVWEKEKGQKENKSLWGGFSYPMRCIVSWVIEDLPLKRIKSSHR